jgi:hypothetical protein
MENVKSIGALIGAQEAPAGSGEMRPREAAQSLWASDFEGAPEWFMRKYFENDEGKACGRMHVKAFAKIGAVLTKDGQVMTTRRGEVMRLTTGRLAKRVEEDCAEAGFPGVRVHFKGYSLEPELFVMLTAEAQEDYEENEARHVPGLDPDEGQEPSNAQAALDAESWESCACFVMNALRSRTLMYWGLDEDFGKVIMGASSHVHAAYNAYLRGLWLRISSMVNMETLRFLEEWDDFSLFDKEDVVRTYTKAMRCLTGKEYGESMLEDAATLDPEMDMESVKKASTAVESGTLSAESAASREEMAALILANEDPTEAPRWEYEAKDEDLLDDDSGDVATRMLLRY